MGMIASLQSSSARQWLPALRLHKGLQIPHHPFTHWTLPLDAFPCHSPTTGNQQQHLPEYAVANTGLWRNVIGCAAANEQRGPWCAERFASRLEAVGGVEIDYINILQGGYKGFSKLYINDQDLVDTSNMNQYFME